MTLLNAESRHDSARQIDFGREPQGEAWFLQPTVDRIITGSGLAGGPLRTALQNRALMARRIAIGRQVMKVISKSVTQL